MRVGVPDLGRDKWKNRTETGKNAQFSRFFGFEGNFPILSLNCKNTPHLIIMTQDIHSSLIEPET